MMLAVEVFIFASFIVSNVCAYRIGYNKAIDDRLREAVRRERARYTR